MAAGSDHASPGGAAGAPPTPLTRLVGRERELARVAELLGTTRLLTLTGSGGVGKTRLALAVAGAVAACFRDGVAWVDLAPLADAALVTDAVAAALGVREAAGHAPLATLLAALRGRHVLVAVDNAEHLVDAVAQLAEAMLAACPSLTLLTTSREPLGIVGEVTWRVPSLAVPDPDLARPDDLARVDAAALFLDRARAADPDFALTAANAAAVAEVCRRLDGIPLALELAAARVRALPMAQLAARLDRSLAVLTGGGRAALPRHRTLRATLDWSHALLAAPERALLRRLAVFAGGCTLEAAEAVCAGQGIDPDAVLDLLARLVDTSLAQMEEHAGAARYRLLETVRQYAWERLAEADEDRAVRDRHASWCLELAEVAAPERLGQEQMVRLTRLDADADNLRAALDWLLASDPAAGLRLAGALWHYWRLRGRHAEGRRWQEAALARAPAPSAWRVRALLGAGLHAVHQQDFAGAQAHFEAGLALARALDEARSVAWLLRELGLVALRRGELAGARVALEEALARMRAIDDPRGLGVTLARLARVELAAGAPARARRLAEEGLAVLAAAGERWIGYHPLNALGLVAEAGGDYAGARAWHAAALAVAEEMGDPLMTAQFRTALGRVALATGDLAGAETELAAALALARRHELAPVAAGALAELGALAGQRGEPDRATALLGESLALAEALGDRAYVARARHGLGLAAWRAGDLVRAAAELRASLALRRELGGPLGVVECLEGLGWVAAATARPASAARLLAAAAATREAIGAPPPPAERAAGERAAAAARAALGRAAFAAAWAAGRALPVRDAAAEALAEAPAADTAPAAPGSARAGGPAPLSGREAEVAGLVARGLTNREIAAELSISRRTVSTHLTHVMGKLGLAGRVQVATWAVERGLGAPPRER